MGIESASFIRVDRATAGNNLSSVISFAFFNGKIPDSGPFPDNLNLQLVVRDPATNRTHGDVISVPTMRVPAALIDAVLVLAGKGERHGNTTLYKSERTENVSLDGHHPVIFAVEGILAQKLGVADPLEEGLVTFNAAPVAETVGTSVYNEPQRHYEQIRMVGIEVGLTRGQGLFPARTPSYSSVLWVPVKEFLRSVETKNPAALGLDPFKFCIYGLCIATTYDVLAHRLGLRPFCDLARSPTEG
jgi:hypothetical protein